MAHSTGIMVCYASYVYHVIIQSFCELHSYKEERIYTKAFLGAFSRDGKKCIYVCMYVCVTTLYVKERMQRIRGVIRAKLLKCTQMENGISDPMSMCKMNINLHL